LRLLGAHTHFSVSQLNRLLDSVRVGEERRLDIGLRLLRLEPHLPLSGTDFVEELASAINRYHETCPAVVTWITTGGFHPERIPTHINRATLRHACRTAGRLRAKFLRTTNISGVLQ
jgi:hypothetical protein